MNSQAKEKKGSDLVSAGMFHIEDREKLDLIVFHRVHIRNIRNATKGRVLGELLDREYIRISDELSEYHERMKKKQLAAR